MATIAYVKLDIWELSQYSPGAASTSHQGTAGSTQFSYNYPSKSLCQTLTQERACSRVEIRYYSHDGDRQLFR
ncbi:hypothetical protein [Coleofasciculus sp. FACHB-1120]|uniref:hypothetical protein n=1 Tax=Coleofasciculus sp. FACHB-1120 TaxID=2692783 RepID=UPI001F551CC5|nr:hypothetical protein [Coleofasciculus sp. FACHB-1120]